MQPRVIETKAKTKEEAIEIALKELDAERGEVEIDVVSVGKSGILGIGSEPARVRVTLLDKPTDLVKTTSEVLDSLMSKLGVSVVVSLKQAERPDLGGPVFEIEGDDSGLLIGRRGETLRSLQFLVRVIVGRRLQARANLLIDVEGYQQRRYQTLTNMALNVAQRVAATGRSIPLEPMPPDERRIVHVALAEHAQVTTESTGEGDSRQVVVRPKDE
ncbi:MAG: protein jag [Chloroflexi bacterium]|nr:protein jag [Chloroflexota bacterium]